MQLGSFVYVDYSNGFDDVAGVGGFVGVCPGVLKDEGEGSRGDGIVLLINLVNKFSKIDSYKMRSNNLIYV